MGSPQPVKRPGEGACAIQSQVRTSWLFVPGLPQGGWVPIALSPSFPGCHGLCGFHEWERSSVLPHPGVSLSPSSMGRVQVTFLLGSQGPSRVPWARCPHSLLCPVFSIFVCPLTLLCIPNIGEPLREGLEGGQAHCPELEVVGTEVQDRVAGGWWGWDMEEPQGEELLARYLFEMLVIKGDFGCS